MTYTLVWLVLGIIGGFFMSCMRPGGGRARAVDVVFGVLGAFFGGGLYARFFATAGALGPATLLAASAGAVIAPAVYLTITSNGI